MLIFDWFHKKNYEYFVLYFIFSFLIMWLNLYRRIFHVLLPWKSTDYSKKKLYRLFLILIFRAKKTRGKPQTSISTTQVCLGLPWNFSVRVHLMKLWIMDHRGNLKNENSFTFDFVQIYINNISRGSYLFL